MVNYGLIRGNHGINPSFRPAPERRLPVSYKAMVKLAIVILLLLLTACAGGSTATPEPTPTPAPTPTPTPLPDPRAILERAAERVAAAESLAFVLEHQSGSTLISPGLLLNRAEGVINRPANTLDNTPADFRITLDLEASGSFLQVSVIAVEEGAFMTNLFSGQWEPIDRAAIPFRLDDVAQTFAELIAAVESPELAGEERLEDYAAYRIQGTLPAESLAQLAPAALTGTDVAVEIWADRAEVRLPRALLTGPLSAGDGPEAGRTLTLEAQDPPAEITAPEIPLP